MANDQNDQNEQMIHANEEMLKSDCAALDEFFSFLQCQLRMEAENCLQRSVDITDEKARKLWESFRKWVQPNIGKKQKWVPFHTILGPHELFIVQMIHHNKELPWDKKRRFLAMFIFRAHCQSNLFTEAQLPLMLKESFWKDPVMHFQDEGAVTQSMLAYRRAGRQAMQTSAFRAIPKRLSPDDDVNLARNIALRTRGLLEIAEEVWPILQKRKLKSLDKFEKISKTIQTGKGLGQTWSKMLLMSIDIAYPKLQLLASTCDVGVGALKGLQKLFPSSNMSNPRDVLVQATHAANSLDTETTQSFWQLLAEVEGLAQQRFRKLPLVLNQVSTVSTTTAAGELSVATVQVQLCEWRQFLDFLAKEKPPMPRSSLDGPPDVPDGPVKDDLIDPCAAKVPSSFDRTSNVPEGPAEDESRDSSLVEIGSASGLGQLKHQSRDLSLADMPTSSTMPGSPLKDESKDPSPAEIESTSDLEGQLKDESRGAPLAEIDSTSDLEGPLKDESREPSLAEIDSTSDLEGPLKDESREPSLAEMDSTSDLEGPLKDESREPSFAEIDSTSDLEGPLKDESREPSLAEIESTSDLEGPLKDESREPSLADMPTSSTIPDGPLRDQAKDPSPSEMPNTSEPEDGMKDEVGEPCLAANGGDAPDPPDIVAGFAPCMSRIWNNGRGGQCSRARIEGSDYCKSHQQQVKKRGRLTHGRIDGDVPPEKQKEFEAAQSRLKRAKCEPQKTAI